MHISNIFNIIIPMNSENIKSQMRKGMLEYCILLLLNKQKAYASDIIRNLKDAHLIVVEGTLYPLLTRMKNAGMLDYNWMESSQGPPRKYYYINDNGKRLLEELEKNWDEISGTINHLKNFSIK